jgi:hypothetical protein
MKSLFRKLIIIADILTDFLKSKERTAVEEWPKRAIGRLSIERNLSIFECAVNEFVA